ncbi:MAG TPA: ABC transporter permease [Candidatus Latescibacteria bacterium]|nr:ABC transporter permease [Candidatus Latescibacterota bacterium]
MNQKHLKYTFVGPALIVLIGLNIFPLFYNIYLSFTDAELSGGLIRWIGSENFTRVFDNPRYATAIRTTGVFVFSAVSIELILGYTLALCLHDDFKGKSAVLTILLVPMMLSPAVIGLYWHVILSGHFGVLNQILSLLSAGQPLWLTDPDLKMISILLIDVWMWTPFMMLISLAGLNAIPKHLYEAAVIDRATPWTIFRRITLPLSAPMIFLAVLFRATDALKQFDLVMALTGPNDGATQTLSALLYQVVFRSYKVGLGAAYGLVILVFVIALSSVFIRYIQRVQASQGRA